MPSFLQDFEESICLDGGMRNSVSRVEALLEQPPLLSPSKEGKDLFLYLAVSATAVNAALIR